MWLTALLVGLYCGAVGVLLDLDHVIAYRLGRINTNARVWHKPVGIIAGIIIISCLAYIGGLSIGVVLR